MNLVTFNGEMVTPKIITVLYWLMLLVVLFSGLGFMFGGGAAGHWFLSFIGGLIGIAVGAIMVRVYCELMIVLFKMNEALQDIRKNKAP